MILSEQTRRDMHLFEAQLSGVSPLLDAEIGVYKQLDDAIEHGTSMEEVILLLCAAATTTHVCLLELYAKRSGVTK